MQCPRDIDDGLGNLGILGVGRKKKARSNFPKDQKISSLDAQGPSAERHVPKPAWSE